MTCQLFLRTTDANGQSYGGFQWPMEVGATVEAPDWDETPECGRGLHGLLNGEGEGSHLSSADDAIWWIVEAEGAVDLNGKHKFRSCTVVAFGTRFDVANEMKRRTNAAVHGCDATAGDRGTATAGRWGTATAGRWGTATAGHWGTATAGNEGTATAGDRGTATAGGWGTATAGNEGTATAGGWGTATAGHWGTATAGNEGTATAGHWGTATAGNEGTATAGDRGTATAGGWGTATAGDRGTATAGDSGTIVFTKWHNGRVRYLVGYVGEGGIEPNVAYRASDDFTKIIRAE